MNQYENLIATFYKSFQNLDYRGMNELYHPKAKFHDPVFGDLNANEVKAMWQMLLSSAKDLKISYQDIKADAIQGNCCWEAWYTFSKTGRPVHNIINASFDFKDGKILNHNDLFDLWRWSRYALGFTGVALGWSPIVKNKIRNTAQQSLRKFISSKAAQ